MSIIPVKNDPNVVLNRKDFVGGSDVPIILGLSPYKTQFQLAQEKVGIKDSSFKGDEYTEFGNVLEPQIRDYINTVNEVRFKEATEVNKDRWIRSNVDGFEKEHKMILEIKTHGKNPTMKAYQAQMQLYMWQFDVEHGWLALYERPEDFNIEFDSDRLKIIVINRDEEQIKNILDAIETFWIRCEFLQDNPDATELDFYNYGQNEVALFANEISKLEVQLAQFQQLQEQYKEAKKKLHDAMEEYDIKKFETDLVVITRVLPTERRSIDSKRLNEEMPDVAAQYERVSKVTGSVRIKLKEAK